MEGLCQKRFRTRRLFAEQGAKIDCSVPQFDFFRLSPEFRIPLIGKDFTGYLRSASRLDCKIRDCDFPVDSAAGDCQERSLSRRAFFRAELVDDQIFPGEKLFHHAQAKGFVRGVMLVDDRRLSGLLRLNYRFESVLFPGFQ